MLGDTRWRALDYLVLDLPPGTGDLQLSMAQRIAVAGAIIVTTPQDVALLDARKGLRMFEKVSVPVLGVVENMSFHICTHCGHRDTIFGEGGGERLAEEAGVELLGQLPLQRRVREQTDSGRPPVVAEPDGETAQLYRALARRVAARLAYGRQSAGSFPEIVISDD
jgi:ATP-binding protein involved in chromosome partitioning